MERARISLRNLLAIAEIKGREAREAQEALDHATEASRQAQMRVIEAVKNGESTGNSVDDLAILFGRSLKPETFDAFRTFAERLEGKKGQLIALQYIGRHRIRYSIHSMMGDDGYQVFEASLFSVLDDDILRWVKNDKLILTLETNPILTLETTRCVSVEGALCITEKFRILDKPLFGNTYWDWEYNGPVGFPLGDFIEPRESRPETLHIGDAEVRNYLVSEHVEKPDAFMDKIREMCGQLVLRGE